MHAWLFYRGASFAYAFVVTRLTYLASFAWQSQSSGKPISFKQYTEDYKPAWL